MFLEWFGVFFFFLGGGGVFLEWFVVFGGNSMDRAQSGGSKQRKESSFRERKLFFCEVKFFTSFFLQASK